MRMLALADTRQLQAEPLGVAPELVGRRLASPGRRAMAMAIDLALIALLSGSSRLWLVAGLVVLLLQLLSAQGGVPRRAQPVLAWIGVCIVAVLVAAELHQRLAPAPVHAAREQPPAAAASAAALLGAAARQAASAATGGAVDPAAVLAEALKEAAEDGGFAAAAAGAASGAASGPEARIAELEDRLASTRRALHRAERARGIGHWLEAQADELAGAFGWAIVYFSLLPAWWRGQTVGKKLLKLRVRELSGAPMTVLRCLKRYGGYAAGMATGGIGFAQILWEPNRQGLQDRAAHTAVFDERGAPA